MVIGLHTWLRSCFMARLRAASWRRFWKSCESGDALLHHTCNLVTVHELVVQGDSELSCLPQFLRLRHELTLGMSNVFVDTGAQTDSAREEHPSSMRDTTTS